ncbi:MAG: hypothetical protein BWY21_00324 [Parcubacteria group bacterium ADurb.Bin216]|nr:MAG: hypothetical protein BWY21_00324 [Parcubacteria group bacterium ADurb.Bin216]
MAKKKTKKRKPQDTTLRNNRARVREINRVKEYVCKLEQRIKMLEKWQLDVIGGLKF